MSTTNLSRPRRQRLSDIGFLVYELRDEIARVLYKIDRLEVRLNKCNHQEGALEAVVEKVSKPVKRSKDVKVDTECEVVTMDVETNTQVINLE